MRLTVIGCSGSFPAADSPASCYLLEADGFRLVLDMGNGAFGALQRHVDMFDIDAVCLTHLHADHCLDLCVYHVARTYGPDGRQPPIPVYGPAGTRGRIAAAYALPDEPEPDLAFDFRTLLPGTLEIGPFRLTADRVSHPVETFAFRIEHGGRSLCYSGDTGPSQTLVKLADSVDVLLCEAGNQEPRRSPAIHLTGQEAGEHAAKAEVGHLVLTHLVPWNDRARTLEEAGRTYPGAMTVAAPGLTLVLP